jgi:DNA-binding transcriptional MerR regulator
MDQVADQVAAKIARWKELYFELNDVRSRLRDGPADAGASASQLRFELRRLQRESEKVLDELLAAVAAVGQPDCRCSA